MVPSAPRDLDPVLWDRIIQWPICNFQAEMESRSRFTGSDKPLVSIRHTQSVTRFRPLPCSITCGGRTAHPPLRTIQTAGFDPSHPTCDEIPSPTMLYIMWGTNRSPTSPYSSNAKWQDLGLQCNEELFSKQLQQDRGENQNTS